MRLKASLCLLVACLFFGCSSKDMKKKNYTLQKIPASFVQKLNKNEKSFLLVSLNDLNSQLSGLSGQGPSIGGLKMIDRYLSIVKEVFQGNNLILSTGYLTRKRSSQEQQHYVYQALGKLPIDGIGMTARELSARESLESPLINSNIYDIATRSLIEDKHIRPYRIFERGGLKIGVLSVTPPAPEEVLNGLYFEDAVASILKHYKELKKEGVDLVTLISHYPPLCKTESPQFEADRKLVCEDESILKKILKRLPRNEVDIAITTGEHFSFGKIHDVYVMNNPGNGLYIDLIKIVYDVELKKINHQKTKHFGPILLCETFYDLTKDCFIGNSHERFQKLKETNFKQMPASFLGKPIISK
jgi:2',3'-cyclic-nucleotide 2'-phosphodiesterase (5'-nucleotidase family)